MARSGAANRDSRDDFVPGQAQNMRSPAPHKSQQPWLKPASTVLLRIEPWLAKIVPILIGIFLTTMALAAAVQALADRDRVSLTAFRAVELDSMLLAERIDAFSPPGDVAGLIDALKTLVPDASLIQARRFLLINEAGRILAERAPKPSGAQQIEEIVGSDQAILTLAEQAGVMNITLANGRQALATMRKMPRQRLQLVMVAPVDAILDGWGQSVLRQTLLLLSVAILLGLVAAAYFWQSGKARESETACDEIRVRIDTALNRGKCGLWDWDIARGQIYWSQSMFEILGLPPRASSLSIGEIRDITHPGDANLASMAQIIAEGANTTIDHMFRMRHANGHWAWLRMRAEIVRDSKTAGQHVVGIAMDITEEKNHRDTSHIADIRLHDAIDTISEAFVLWDADNRLAMCNAKFRQLHKIPSELSCIGMSYEEFMAVGTPPTAQNPVKFDAHKTKSSRNFVAQLDDGRWMQVSERRTRDGGYVSVGTDITRLKEHEEQLMQSETQLMGTVTDLRRSRQDMEKQAQQLIALAQDYQAQKLEAEAATATKARFLANMSHELRTPLNAIIGFSEMMQHQTFGPLGHAKYVDYASSIVSSGTYLHSIISDVLEMSRLESGEIKLDPQIFEIKPLFARLTHHFQGLASAKTIQLSFSIRNVSEIFADSSILEKALTPLLQNAIKFTPDGGSVVLGACVQNEDLLISVQDNGVGIPVQVLGQVLKPFEQGEAALKNGMKGSGLGLSIARAMTQLHGGKMKIDSPNCQGTKVSIVLPNCLRLHAPNSSGERNRNTNPPSSHAA